MTSKAPAEEAVERATRPIVGMHNRTAQEVFDIMCDRVRFALHAESLRAARLQAERDRAVKALAEIADLGPATCEITLATTMAQLAAEAISTLPPPVKEAEPAAPSRVVTAEPYLAAIAGRPDDLDVLGALPDIIAHWVANNLGVALTLTEARQAARAALTTPPALQARGPRDAMLDRSEEEWEALEEATVQVYSLRAGHTLTDDDIAALHLVDRCQREDEESATDAYHRGLETGLRKRGGDELVNLEKRVNDAIISRATEKAMRGLAEQRANAAEFVLSLCLAALRARVEALEKVVKPAETVMRYLEEHGPDIVPHLLDSDDNPGQRLRDALSALTGEKEGEADGR